MNISKDVTPNYRVLKGAPAKALRTAFSSLAAQLMDICTVFPRDDGWHIRAVSPCTTTMVDVVIHRDAFGDYEPWEPFGVKAEAMLDSLAPGTAEVDISLSGGRLIIKDGNMTHRRALYPAEDFPRSPDLVNLASEVMLPMSTLMGVMVKGDPKHGAAVLEATPDAYRVSCLDADDMGTVLEIPKEDCMLLDGESKGMFALSAWMPFLRALPKGVDLDMRTSSGFPMVVTVSDEHMTLTWMVAPMLMSEDD